MNNFVENVIKENADVKTLFVLAGYEVPECNLAEIINKKIKRVVYLDSLDVPVISYDEYLLMKASFYEVFDRIIIIKNPLYHDLYPVIVNIEDKIKTALENHFNDDAAQDSNVSGIKDYIEIYRNFLKTPCGNIACTYNDDDVSEDSKVIIKSEPVSASDTEEISSFDGNVIEIRSEEDYFDFVHMCEEKEGQAVCSIDTDVVDLSLTKRYIDTLNQYYNGKVRILKTPKTRESKDEINPEIVETMKKYWKFDTFRSFRTYDIDALEKNEKKIINVSQSQIINDIVTQAKNASENKDASDIFVTAPTGAGKSLLFQLPAIYLAEKYGLVTLVISPLIGLMKDQVESLREKGYTKARTINSDLPPVIKKQILEEVAQGECDILYLSPESLLGKSSIEQLIGNRKIGMVVIDESHIVTTWGKQFRPDYWFLGDHITKIRRGQKRREDDPSSFIIATFTATAIYGGEENMHQETLTSLNMVNTITYLGYVKRDNISIDISLPETKSKKVEYELNKFDLIIEDLRRAIRRGQKTLVYFPTVALIERFYRYCTTTAVGNYIVKYHGQMEASEKNESFDSFRDGTKPVMIATKAFGMGIDIPDIVNVIHFAPTGNVCDYIQEIGRAGRDTNIEGHAIYRHMTNDFKHINRLHGLSAIRKYQLIEVMKKLIDIYDRKMQEETDFYTKKRNGMTIDAENFGYIFRRAGDYDDDSQIINKVKTALLLIQKGTNQNFSPFHMRPETLFRYGFFNASKADINKLNKIYFNVAECVSKEENIYKINLENIWDKSYSEKMSFAKFKYLLYTGSDEIHINKICDLKSAIKVEFKLKADAKDKYEKVISALKSITGESVVNGKYYDINGLAKILSEKTGLSKYSSENVINIFLASLDEYKKKFHKGLNSKCYSTRSNKNGNVIYTFSSDIEFFFKWVKRNKDEIFSHSETGSFYVVNENSNRSSEISTVLGLLESFNVLTFNSLGGLNSQIYIYVNETKSMRFAVKAPEKYKNRLLDNIMKHHETSVAMLKYLFQNNLKSDEIWEHLENYLLGTLPEGIGKCSE